jgi:type IV pilus assembly protein PilB
MSYLRIDEHRLPQDGKIAYKLFGGKSIDMRVSVIPTIYGEKIVIRLLKKDEKPPELKDL